jgi:hypothetical protein
VHHRFRNVAPSFSGDIELQLLRNLPTIGAHFSAAQKSRRDFIAITVADTGIATRFARRSTVFGVECLLPSAPRYLPPLYWALSVGR